MPKVINAGDRNACTMLIADIQALENRAHRLGMTITGHALNNAKNASGWELAGETELAGKASRGERAPTLMASQGITMDPIKEAMIREEDTGERDKRLDPYREWPSRRLQPINDLSAECGTPCEACAEYQNLMRQNTELVTALTATTKNLRVLEAIWRDTGDTKMADLVRVNCEGNERTLRRARGEGDSNVQTM